MTCRWCGNDNVLGRAICPHCGEDTRKLEEVFGPQAEDDDTEEVEEPLDGLRSTAVQVGKSLAVSAIAVAVLVGGAKSAHSSWPVTMWPRSLPSYSPEAGEGGSGAPPSGDAVRCERRGTVVTDPDDMTFDRWYCTVERTGSLYAEPDASTPVTGYLNVHVNWFACQIQGATDPESGGDTWFYTQGDDRYDNEGWGYFPAGFVSSSWGRWPAPDLPTCPP